MHLSSEEEARLRAQVRAGLERVAQERRRRSETYRREEELQRIEEEKRRIIEDEERRFYEEQGLQRYINHRGEVEWLPPEEIERRKKSRRKKKPRRSSHHHRSTSKRGRNILEAVLAVVIFGMAGTFMYFEIWSSKESDIGKSEETFLQVRSNIEGATVYIDGQATGYVTNASLRGLPEGPHVVSVVKPGYSAVPTEVQVVVTAGDSVEAMFELSETYW